VRSSFAHYTISDTRSRVDELADVRDVFTACCVLHNMLLAHDAAIVRVENEDPEFGRHDDQIVGTRFRSIDFASSSATNDVIVHPDLDVSGTGMQNAPTDIPFFFSDGRSEGLHYTLRNALARHLRVQAMQQ
jgi:hypothetical protein